MNQYDFTQRPNEERLFTISDIQKICGASPTIIRDISERAGIESFVSKKRRNSIVYDFCSMKQIIAIYNNLIGADEVRSKNKAEPKTIEQLRAEHPLVKDDVFFKLTYFPDVIPKCFLVD